MARAAGTDGAPAESVEGPKLGAIDRPITVADDVGRYGVSESLRAHFSLRSRDRLLRL